MNTQSQQWRVVATRNGREFFSWHSSKEQAKQAAKDQRSRGLFSSVRVEEAR